MASLLLALAAGAVFKGVDGASATSGASKARAIAASIAQEDQERLRATTPSTLVDLNTTKTVRRSGVDYSLQSVARWVADRDATPGCTSATSRAGYLRITSKVTWPDMRGSKPITATSLVAPPNGTVTSNRGAIGVKVIDQNSQPVPGVTVDVSGASLTGVTDSDGCAYWDDVPQGNYSYTAQKLGYVDYNGNSSVTRPIGVAGGQTRIDTVVIGQPTEMTVAVKTKGYDGQDYPVALNTGDKLFLANSKMTATNGVRAWSLTSTTATVSGLFPMQYGVYAGTCPFENNPANQSVTTGVFNPPFTGTQTIYAPMFKLRARYNGATTGDNFAYVKAVQIPSGGACTKEYPSGTDITTWYRTGAVNDSNATTDDNGRLLPDPANTSTPIPGFPYGSYKVCAQSRGSASGGTWRYGTASVTNNSPSGVTVDINMATSGQCPAVFW